MYDTKVLTECFNYELHCSECNTRYNKDELNTVASCSGCIAKPLIVRFDLPATPTSIIQLDERSMWRYRKLLPVSDNENIVTLGEGWTPMLKAGKLALAVGLDQLFIKDESFNPTASFKARGLSMAVSKAKELGVEACIIPTAGNAGGALSAYCARAGMKAVVVMPSHTPAAFMKECRAFGAEIILVDGLISDCAKKAAELKVINGYFDISTLKEPYRLEGKKTMGYEIAEQMNWTLPDVILYPTGGGTGLIGIWKAIEEMNQLGWINAPMPRMIAVQADNCKPIVETFYNRQPNAANYKGSATIANGLAVPHPFAERLIIKILKNSNGTAVAVTDEAIVPAMKQVAATEGILMAPEGAALLAAMKILINNGTIKRTDRVLLLNTGAAYKYFDNLSL